MAVMQSILNVKLEGKETNNKFHLGKNYYILQVQVDISKWTLNSNVIPTFIQRSCYPIVE